MFCDVAYITNESVNESYVNEKSPMIYDILFNYSVHYSARSNSMSHNTYVNLKVLYLSTFNLVLYAIINTGQLYV